MDKRRRAPHHRNSDLNIRISNLLAACVKDLMDTGEPKVAESIVNVLMIEDLTSDMTSISSIASAIQSGIEEAVTSVNEAVQEAQAEVSQILGLTTTPSPLSSETPSTTTTTIDAQTTTTPPPLASFKCAIYENMYINTWHYTNEATPPIKNCASSSGNFEIVKNKFVRYTLRTSGSSIDELTLILFDEASTKAICTVSGVGQDFGWMDCEENGINPSLIKTATHETLTVYYAKGNFTTIVTHDIGVNVGRFVIDVYQSPDLAIHSTGELSSNLKGLIGISLYARLQIQSLPFKPKLLFVLHDQMSRDENIFLEQLNRLKDNLQASSSILNVSNNDEFEIKQEDIVLLPSAFNEEQKQTTEQLDNNSTNNIQVTADINLKNFIEDSFKQLKDLTDELINDAIDEYEQSAQSYHADIKSNRLKNIDPRIRCAE
ncbi:unnamed protein product [Adineta steineri]|uniref:Uncharacterized protein n=1 Tax=Adineta steineri TaxID=433720 RepID=A0A814C8I9_9BILA|nr:unnamed protein product [Adineta steineri]CAF1487998.1 unnamed protein product [Adineta steineri]